MKRLLCLLLLAAGCARAGRPDQGVPPTENARALAAAEDELGRAAAALDTTALEPRPIDCDRARGLRDDICRLSEKICTLVARDARLENGPARCQDARGRCQSARKLVAGACGPEGR
jgi:hypothetical protein